MPLSKKKLEKQAQERLGKISYNKYNTKMKIVEYNRYNDIWIEFQVEYKVKIHTTYKEFKNGNVSNPYDKSVCNVGYLGQGIYNVREKGEQTKCYRTWLNMIRRCYDAYELNKHPIYIDVFVCEEWHCFQNFAKWYKENYYECNNEQMHLDKDILVKSNKIYSSETCIFVPERINKLFIKQQNKRGKYPIGVSEHYDKRCDLKCLHTLINYEGKIKSLGYFPLNKPFQAFYAYKIFKENYIKQVADEYKDFIPKKLYDALYKYEVEIND